MPPESAKVNRLSVDEKLARVPVQRSHANLEPVNVDRIGVGAVQEDLHRVQVARLRVHEIRPPRLHVLDLDVALHLARGRLGDDLSLLVEHPDRHRQPGLRCVAVHLEEDAAARVDDVRRRDDVVNVLDGRRVERDRPMDAGVIEEVERVRLDDRRPVVAREIE